MTAVKATKSDSSKWKRIGYCSKPHRLISKRKPSSYIYMLSSLREKNQHFYRITLKIFAFNQPYPFQFSRFFAYFSIKCKTNYLFITIFPCS